MVCAFLHNFSFDHYADTLGGEIPHFVLASGISSSFPQIGQSRKRRKTGERLRVRFPSLPLLSFSSLTLVIVGTACRCVMEWNIRPIDHPRGPRGLLACGARISIINTDRRYWKMLRRGCCLDFSAYVTEPLLARLQPRRAFVCAATEVEELLFGTSIFCGTRSVKGVMSSRAPNLSGVL